MRTYKGRKNIFIKRVAVSTLILAVVFAGAYFGITKIIDIPFDKLFQKVEIKNVEVNNTNANTNNNQNKITSISSDKNMTTLYVVFDSKSDKSATEQLSQIIATLDKSSINTIGFDISYLQIGKNESKDFDIQQLVKTAADAGFKTIMRVDTLSLPKQSDISWEHAVLTKNSVTWLDRNNLMWLNPYSTNGVGEVIKIYCESAKKYGFNVIELNKLGFFMEGRLELVYFGENDSIQNRSIALSTLVNTAKESLKDSNVRLAISIDTLGLLDTKKASIAQNSNDMIKQADIVIPYIIISNITSNKDALSVLNLDEKADPIIIYKAVLDKLGIEKTKLMPCIDISLIKDNAMANKEFINKIIDSQKELKLYGIEFYNTTGSYKIEDYKIS